MADENITGVHLEWPMNRTSRAFVVRVVEPDSYDPRSHLRIFNAVIQHMIGPQPDQIIDAHDARPQSSPEPFDLIAFPEAFVDSNALLTALQALSQSGSTGCIHVGLRPDNSDATHLFCPQQMSDLVQRIRAVEFVAEQDLSAFSAWVDRQTAAHFFNLGAVFAVDANRRLRICLHPKQVRSQYEFAALPEKHMTEADLLSVITLYPSNKVLRSVVLQPIICSDFLRLPRDGGGVPPVQGVNVHAGKLLAHAPDHIDVISVVACTPHPVTREPPARRWQEKFLEAFKETQDAMVPRHNFAAVIVANFRHLASRAPGGLSGAFLPIAVKSTTLHPSIVTTYYGRKDASSQNRWSEPQDDTSGWQNLGFVASLDACAEPAASPVRIFEFTIQRLPRDNAVWERRPPGLSNCIVSAATVEADGSFRFQEVV